MPLKTYETIGTLNRYITAVIEGREIPIQFVNGTDSPRRIQGRYTTADHRIHEWLEDNPGFNRRWRLVSTVPVAADKKPKDETVHSTPPDELVNDDLAVHNIPPDNTSQQDDLGTSPGSVVEETDEDIAPEPEAIDMTIIVGDQVVNGQQARNYLMERFKDLTFRQVQNNTQIIAEAKARNIQFTHWEAFVTSK